MRKIRKPMTARMTVMTASSRKICRCREVLPAAATPALLLLSFQDFLGLEGGLDSAMRISWAHVPGACSRGLTGFQIEPCWGRGPWFVIRSRGEFQGAANGGLVCLESFH